MDTELKTLLRETHGLTDEQIIGIKDLGVTTAADMEFVVAEDLTALGIKVIVARKIVAAFTPEADQSTPVSASPVNVTVQTGKLEDKSLRELLEMLAGGEKSVELKTAIREKTQGRQFFVRVESGEKLDVESSLECYEFVVETKTTPPMWGNVPVESFEEILEKRREADPLTGEALTNWVNPNNGLSWKKVSEQHRVYAAFASLNGLLEGNPDHFVLAKELEQEELSGRWTKVLALYQRAEKTEQEKIAAAQAALWYRKGGRSGSGTHPFRSQQLEI